MIEDLHEFRTGVHVNRVALDDPDGAGMLYKPVKPSSHVL